MRRSPEQEPSKHSFLTGNMVHLSKRYPPRKAAPGPYKVVCQLPERDGQLQYRIKSGCEPFYRTVKENELEAAASPLVPEPGMRATSLGIDTPPNAERRSR
jgi:hypothetical protein